jgi:hypothetical protein
MTCCYLLVSIAPTPPPSIIDPTHTTRKIVIDIPAFGLYVLSIGLQIVEVRCDTATGTSVA